MPSKRTEEIRNKNYTHFPANVSKYGGPPAPILHPRAVLPLRLPSEDEIAEFKVFYQKTRKYLRSPRELLLPAAILALLC